MVTSEPEDTKVYLGDPVMLFCGIMGLPTPAIQWYQDAEPLPNATSPSLTIQAAQPDDRGYYTCIGSNSHGNASSRPTIVSLYGKYVHASTILLHDEVPYIHVINI